MSVSMNECLNVSTNDRMGERASLGASDRTHGYINADRQRYNGGLYSGVFPILSTIIESDNSTLFIHHRVFTSITLIGPVWD